MYSHRALCTISVPDSARGAISAVRLPLRGLLVAGANSTCYYMYNDHMLLESYSARQ